MESKDVPNWILSLDIEDIEFIKNFVINSGSLKEIAKFYGVSYPTVRIRLDKLIQKIKINNSAENEEFISFIKKLSIDDRISLDDAKMIIDKYKKEREEE
ncbi:DUF2089 family protein [Peribacillus simplex]|uniref:DUF2089 family protein n=1 Tax=Peribacillus simplex TaxID=1478 RepID=UPI0025A2D064|nr:DUF2089 family protein [Peribacillus simplex]MDM5291893.1 DUF2089 family protein [Peribacillus simplex]